MTGLAQRLFVHLQQVGVVAAVGIVTGETAVGERLVLVFLFELRGVVTGEAKLFRRLRQQHVEIARVRIMTCRAVAFGSRLVDKCLLEAKVRFLMTQEAELGPVFFQSEGAYKAVGLVTGETVFGAERFVLYLPFEIRHLMTVQAIALFGEPFPRLDLRLRQAAQTEHEHNRNQKAQPPEQSEVVVVCSYSHFRMPYILSRYRNTDPHSCLRRQFSNAL